MEFINKTILEAEVVVSKFLRELKKEGLSYPKDLYQAFDAPNEDGIIPKDLLINFLLQEQHNYCCYCMRKLYSKEEMTLEHLIPQGKETSKQDFDKYLRPNIVLNDKKICFAKEFIDKEELNFPPFPHTIAYQNLVASCNGKFSKSDSVTHCNSHRSHQYIEPIILNKSIVEQIEYKSDGFVIWKNDMELIPTLNKLGLNNERLKMTRHIWFYANKHGYDLLKLNTSQKNKFLYKLLEEIPEKEFDVLFDFTKDYYWKIVIEKYDYFSKLKKLARQLINLTEKELEVLKESVK